MKGLPLAVTIFLILALAGYATQNTQAQPSAEEAKQIFENIGCISCHAGNPLQPAANWDLIIQFMEEWSQKYPSIDEAIRNEVVYYGGQKFNSFEELMERMSQNVGKTRNDPEIQQLEAFFRSFWGQEQAQTPQQTEPAQTPEQTEQEETQVQEQTQTVQQTPAQEEAEGVKGGKEPRIGITLTIISIALVILITVVAAIYLTRR
ncbi:MAG: hypothetical protein F7C08_01425 [Desulfurococcales archaeon]|nr:hypothetical protein [Desulfurococcales archaeon]MCE4605179.1 hypothetical protein [Desulfurococcales archaeon]